MGDPTTIALNLTFFGTLAVALVMFFGLFLVFVATLVIAGLGRLCAVTVMGLGRALFRTGRKTAGTSQRNTTVRFAGTTGNRPPAKGPKAAPPAKPARPAKAAKNEATLSPGWAAAVARADGRAAARAKAEAAPAVRVSVRELPDPAAPARDLTAVAPLVESATDPNGRPGTGPAAFKKAPVPAVNSLLDTGSLVSRPGRFPLPRKSQGAPAAEAAGQQANHRPKPAAHAQERKAG
ncbi:MULTISPECIES: hypothetical protein [unclassified Arthrobacter]|uniref:hypothetical protein n=1 Tax=unclassified Arthrobacter TaxID=235627 RepID=UPI002DFBB8DB|nr:MULTISPECIES: hypothetical protein [unclassified Arthrobacter]MEC5190668.1 hypothetical protein [Arthrobacter sp. MP_M4]MEC5202752.1 hypothetical protein [Arthrobacter sp. MP_M7]